MCFVLFCEKNSKILIIFILGGYLFGGSLWGYTLWGINGMPPEMCLVLLCEKNSKILIIFFGGGTYLGVPFGVIPCKVLMVCPQKCVWCYYVKIFWGVPVWMHPVGLNPVRYLWYAARNVFGFTFLMYMQKKQKETTLKSISA